MPHTVLVVDDVPDILSLMKRLLKMGGYAPLTAGGGEEALAVALKQRPDLILLDMMMPGMDGVDVLQAIRSHPELCNVPVILYTAMGEGERLRDAGRYGPCDLIVKGDVDVPELLSQIASHLPEG